MPELSQHQHFAPLVGKRFDFAGQHVVLHLTTIDVKRPHGGSDPGRTPFTLIFDGPAGDVLPEGLYQTHVEGGAVVELYIMPIHTLDPDRQAYQAVFN
jgi:hypothetical protein